MMRRAYLSGLLIAALPTQVVGKTPDCSGLERYPASEAYVYLKNAGILTPEAVIFERGASRMIVSQRVGRDLWRQVFRVTFPLKSGSKIEAIVVNDTSMEECSMGRTQIFLISKELN